MKRVFVSLVLASAIVLVSTTASAQSASTGGIAGDVTDVTGAVLPGVTIEVSSASLIEKVRTAVTDGEGKFNILDLRPGTYVVIFSLPGFTTVRREGLELSAGFTASTNAVMRVGAVEETIVVTGASPIVDTQNVRTQNVLSHQVLDAVPTAKALPGLAALTLGATGGVQDVGGNQGETPTAFSFHGGSTTDQRIKYDGMSMNIFTGNGGGASRKMLLNQVAIEEMVLETSGAAAESETSGIQINAVPRDGGNKFHLYSLGNYTNGDLQSTNTTPDLAAAGAPAPPSVKKIYDMGIGVGGPVKRDALWFYSANRWWGTQEFLPNAYWNAAAGTPFYVPDLTRQVSDEDVLTDYSVRFTWQAAAKHKISVSEDAQRSCVCPFGASATRTPDAADDFKYGGFDGSHQGFQHMLQTSWTHPVTNRLFFDAGASFGFFVQANTPIDNAYTRINITDSGRNITYNALSGSLFSSVYSIDPTGRQVNNPSYNLNQRFAVSYVTGSHALKAGVQTMFGLHDVYRSLTQVPVQYTFLNQVPVSLTEWTSPVVLRSRLFGSGAFVQDQWRIQRLALNLGIRYDGFNGRTLPEHLPPAMFVGARDWPAVSNVPNWKDINPRFGAAYDLFGNGKTAVKASLGRYIASMGVLISEANHPAQQEVNNVTRTWNDSFYPVGDPRRGNYQPDCDLPSPGANGECGGISNTLFGTSVVRNRYDPAVLNGSGQRDYNWQGAVSVQHELRDGIGANAAYFRRWFGNFRATENVAVSPQDFDQFCIPVPNDARLPGAGQPLCGFYDVRPSAFGVQDNLVVAASQLGKETQVYDGLELSMNARFAGRGRLAGGVSTGRTVFDACDVVDSPVVVTSNQVQTGQQPQFCHYQLPWRGQTQFKLNGSYPLPKNLFDVSAVYQNLPGIPLNATYVATNALILPSLGRNLGQCGAAATCNGTVTVNNLFEPNTKFASRLTQFDLRFSKAITFGARRLQGTVDFYNIFNANTILGVNNRYSSTGVNAWLRPTQILAARLLKFGVQFEW